MNQIQMSSNILRKNLKTFSDENIIVFAVDSQMRENLGDYIRRVRGEKGLSTTDVERNSQKQISSSYVTRLENEPNLNPSFKKLEGLAKGLGIPISEIIRIASQRSEPTDAQIQNLVERFAEGFQASGFDELDENAKEDVLADLADIARLRIERELKRQKAQK